MSTTLGAAATPRSAPATDTLREVESDAELLERLRAGDEKAFVLLVGRYNQQLVRVARTLVGNDAVAEEAVQDTWSGVVRGVERFEGRSSFRTWLFRILANRARSALAHEYRTGSLGAGAVGATTAGAPGFDDHGNWIVPVEPWEQDAVDRLDAAARSAVLVACLAGLPARQRAVVELRDVAGLRGDEVCDLLGITPENQRVLLHRGRSALRAALASEMGGV